MADDERVVAAPGLREVAQIWWDLDVDPVVAWDAAGTTFDLLPPEEDRANGPDAERLRLLALPEPVAEPATVAAALAEGLAACDFPPTEQRAAPGRVRATLRAAGVVTERP